MAATPCRSGHAFHASALCPDQLRYAGDPQTRCLSEIVLLTKGGQMEVNGIADTFLSASNFERSREFYRKLLPFLGMKPVIDSDTSFYCVGGRTAVGISAPASEHAGSAFE
jgi:hypothetical protein